MMGKSKRKPKDMPSTVERQREGKLSRSLEANRILMEDYRASFNTFVMLHRIVFGCDPDTSDVPMEWPAEDD